MKTRHRSRLARLTAAVLLSTACALPAAAGISTGNLALDVRSAVGGDGAVAVTLDGDVATITGNVENIGVAREAVEAAAAHDGVREVVDLTTAD